MKEMNKAKPYAFKNLNVEKKIIIIIIIIIKNNNNNR